MYQAFYKLNIFFAIRFDNSGGTAFPMIRATVAIEVK
jgi:hypothetical protein